MTTTLNTGPLSAIWRVHITSFVGSMAFGATHTYGVLCAPRQVIEHDGEAHRVEGPKYALMRVLDEVTAKELNDLNERFGRDYAISWKAGEHTQQWDNAEQVEEAAVLAFNWLMEQGIIDGRQEPQPVLIVGSDELNPGKPLAGNGTLCRTLQDIYERDEAAGWDWGPEREQCSKEWEAALEPLQFERAEVSRIVAGPGAPPKTKDEDLHIDLATKTVTKEDRW